jgi:hypothetical protein
MPSVLAPPPRENLNGLAARGNESDILPNRHENRGAITAMSQRSQQAETVQIRAGGLALTPLAGSHMVGIKSFSEGRMRRQRIGGFTAVAAFSLLIGHGIAAAQAQGQPPPAPDATAGMTRQVTLTPAEEVAQSEGFLSRMDASRTVVRRQLETARAQRDVVKTLCLNDKLNQLDVAVRSARERREALQAAAQRADADLANHEFTILQVLRQRSDQLTAEANQCIGQEAAFIGDSAVSSTVDPGIVPDPGAFEPPVATVFIPPAPVPVSAVK